MRLTIAALALFATSCAGLHGHDHHEVVWMDYGDNPMMNQEFMATMMKAGTPSDVHAELAKGVGHWSVDMTFWMGPGEDPMKMMGTSNVEMILGGRYMQQHFSGAWMGQEFNGLMIMGFDNLNEEYWSIWLDSSSTGFSLSTGYEDENGNQVMEGWMKDPITPGGRPYRSVTEQVSDDEFTVTMYDSTPDGGEFMNMHMVYTRK